MNNPLRQILVATSSVAVMAAGAAVLNPVAAHAEALDVPITVSGDVYTTQTDIVALPDNGGNGVVCDGASSKEKFELGFQGILDMKDVWEQHKLMVGMATTAGYSAERLRMEGQWVTELTVDPTRVEVLKDLYTVEAVQARFDEANAATGKAFADMMRVKSVDIDPVTGKFTATYRLETKQADGSYTPGAQASQLNAPTGKPEKIFFPTLDNTMFLSREQVEQYAATGASVLATKPRVHGSMTFPQLKGRTINGPFGITISLDEYSELSFDGTGNDVPVKTVIKPLARVLNRSVTPGYELPDEILFQNLSRFGEIGSDPDAALVAPEKTEYKAKAGTWKFAGYEFLPEENGPCGLRIYLAKWMLERVITPKSPVTNTPECGVEKRIEWERIDGVSYVQTKREGTKITLAAQASPGYIFPEDATTEWTIDIAATPCPSVDQSSPNPPVVILPTFPLPDVSPYNPIVIPDFKPQPKPEVKEEPKVEPKVESPKPVENPKAAGKVAGKPGLAKTGADAAGVAGLAALFAMAGAVALRGRRNG